MTKLKRFLLPFILALYPALMPAIAHAQTDFKGYVRFVPTVRPSSPLVGTAYFDQTTNLYYVYDTNGWTALGTTTAATFTSTFTTTTTASPSFSIYRGVTNAETWYAPNYSSGTVPLASGLARAAGFMSYYKFAPADSDAAGIDRTSIFGYMESGGSASLFADLVGVKSRALHLGTGALDSAAGIFGVQASAFNGHGSLATTGGNVTAMYGGRFAAYQQSTSGVATNVYGVNTFVEHDYGTATNTFGLYTRIFGSATPTNAYGVYIDDIKGTTKYSLYAADALAPSYFAANVEIAKTLKIKAVQETKTAPAIASNVLTLDLTAGAYFNVALTSNITTLTISNPAASGNTSSFVLAFTADGSARTISWPASVKWAAGVSPTLTTTNAKVDILTFITWDGGTTYYGLVSGQNF